VCMKGSGGTGPTFSKGRRGQLIHQTTNRPFIGTTCPRSRSSSSSSMHTPAINPKLLGPADGSPGAQLLIGLTHEAAYVSPDQGQAPHVAVEEAGDRPAEVCPGGRVVPSPVSCKAA
jgi:hypothetical protein